ncbi:MAG: sialidase family protein [Imperialibacter sp.]|uniref:sialidase family protein n=1 Tax=Imperialibacter sp. TaxID=2038411 RepID=UPI003A841732
MKKVMNVVALLLIGALSVAGQTAQVNVNEPILPADWNPKLAADLVMANLIKVTSPEAKGAHDASFVMVGSHAYIATMINDVRPGENPEWPYVYNALSIVNIETQKVERIIPFVKGGQAFDNATLPEGACFVPRIIQMSKRYLRCFFASEEPGKRQSQVWYIDFDLKKQGFRSQIYKAKIKTAAGVFDMQPQYYYEDAVANGLIRKPVDYGLYVFEFKEIDGKIYAVLNNFPGRQNGLAVLNKKFDTFELLGHYNEPNDLKLSESAVNQLPDGSWLAICRTESGSLNYAFTTSTNGRVWTKADHRKFVPNGTNSKPTFDKFKGIYYLGWQESTKVNGAFRSVFNIDVSPDGIHWERKYRFECESSFQYPSFVEHKGSVWLTVTQGDTDASRKERIMFGRLE